MRIEHLEPILNLNGADDLNTCFPIVVGHRGISDGNSVCMLRKMQAGRVLVFTK